MCGPGAEEPFGFYTLKHEPITGAGSEGCTGGGMARAAVPEAAAGPVWPRRRETSDTGQQRPSGGACVCGLLPQQEHESASSAGFYAVDEGFTVNTPNALEERHSVSATAWPRQLSLYLAENTDS